MQALLRLAAVDESVYSESIREGRKIHREELIQSKNRALVESTTEAKGTLELERSETANVEVRSKLQGKQRDWQSRARVSSLRKKVLRQKRYWDRVNRSFQIASDSAFGE